MTQDPPKGEPETVQAGRAYDALSSRYDSLQRENPVLAHSAAVSLALVRSAMEHSRFILDIGSGTGREALELAALGKEIVACDPSKQSLARLVEKARDRGISERIRTIAIPASRVDELQAEFGTHAFDGAYASFSLSYEPTLDSLPAKVWDLLRPGAPFLCSIYNRLCLTEVLLFAPFLVPRRSFRRLEGRTRLPVDQFEVVVRSYARVEVLSRFQPYFSFVRSWGIPCIVPPNYLSILLEKAGPLRAGWEEWDRRLNGRWPFRHLGSHTAYLFRTRA